MRLKNRTKTEKPKAVKWRLINNYTIMFDLFKLIQKKEALKLALSSVDSNFADSYRFNFGCDANCGGRCEGGCQGDCYGGCSDGCAGKATDAY